MVVMWHSDVYFVLYLKTFLDELCVMNEYRLITSKCYQHPLKSIHCGDNL